MSYCVFQYHAKTDIETLRRSLLDLFREGIESQRPIAQSEFKKKIPQLHYGSYPVRAEKNVDASLDALHWKYSELTGKYCGCQYWSAEAKALFEKSLDGHGRNPTPKEVREIIRCLQKKTRKEDPADLRKLRIEHEHVFPRADLRGKLLQDRDALLASGCLKAVIDRLATGCVVLKSEHDLVDKIPGDDSNPWLRYKGLIRLAENKNWDPLQQDLIEKAGLL